MNLYFRALLAGMASICLTEAAAAESLFKRLQGPTSAHSVKDTDFRMIGCEITPERSAVCRLEVTNKYRDKGIVVSRGITIQDDLGDEYPVQAGGFGTDTARPKWNQVAVADSSYQLTVIAPNISSRASAVRAVVFPRFLVRTPQGQTLGYIDQVVFAKPAMLTQHQPIVELPVQQTAVQTGAPTAPKAKPPAPVKTVVAATEPSFPTGDLWLTLGFWDYDAVDGQQLPDNGLVLRTVAGSNIGVQWSAHLELKNHAGLRPRVRTLWPVSLNPEQRKVCANYPDYPTYEAYIDMPGEGADGTYHVSNCNAG